jgi:hypothetical protein
MRGFALLAVCAGVAAGAVWADPIPTEQVRWVRQPDARAFARLYPRRAFNAGISGTAVLCCTVNDDGSLSCAAPFEWPQGYGFGDATVEISREFRLAPETVEASRATPDAYLRRQIRWQAGPASPELAAAFTRIAEETQNICGGLATPTS